MERLLTIYFMSDNGAADTAVIGRLELRTPTAEFGPASRGRAYLFTDMAYGLDSATEEDRHLASIGVGTAASIGSHFTLSLDVANALADDLRVKAGDWSLHVVVAGTF